MGASLVREVIRTMPATIKPAEWKLVVVLADELSSETRQGTVKGGRRALCARMGLSEASLKRSFSRLAEAGYELRITIGTDADGKAVFAHEGTSTTYRIPVFVAPRGAQR